MSRPPGGHVIKVMVVVDSRLFADVLAGGLQRSHDIDVVYHGASGGAAAVEMFERTQPDIALLDYVMPGLTGPEATAEILTTSPTAKVILVAGIFGPDQVMAGLEAGAIGFLPKSLRLSQLVKALRQTYHGHPLVYADELANLLDEMNARVRHGDDLSDRFRSLTRREVELLVQLSDGKTVAQAAESLKLSLGTVKNRLTRIYTKTGAGSRIEVVDQARKTGVIPGGCPGSRGS